MVFDKGKKNNIKAYCKIQRVKKIIDKGKSIKVGVSSK